ncbi:MAG: ribosome silencing factor [Flavobacteriales bacterium]
MAGKASGSTKKTTKAKAISEKPKAAKKTAVKKAVKKAPAKKAAAPKKAAHKKAAIKKPAISASQKLADLIIAGMQEIKAENIVLIDLRKLQNTICDFFVIATGNSSTHVEAIAGTLEKEVKKATGEYPWKREGFSNSEWILIDYVSVIAHVFQEHTREFYNLEDLWADAQITKIGK